MISIMSCILTEQIQLDLDGVFASRSQPAQFLFLSSERPEAGAGPQSADGGMPQPMAALLPLSEQTGNSILGG